MPEQRRTTDGGMSIGEVARRAGIASSAIRYYEGIGILPAPRRAGGRRRYDPSVLEWLDLVALAREAGFTVAEVRELVRGFAPGTFPAARWRTLATRKLGELDRLAARVERMRDVLQVALDCGCLSLEACGPRFRTAPVQIASRATSRARRARSAPAATPA